MKVSNFGDVKNQFVINDGTNEYFQSYDKIIVKIDSDAEVYLDKEYWDYSKTTSKYRNKFLNKTTKEVKQCVKDGTYKLTNLN